MAEGARLESVYAGNRIAGSNPVLSAMKKQPRKSGLFFHAYKWKCPAGKGGTSQRARRVDQL